jgi:ferrochelatase
MRKNAELVFSAHSVPLAMAETSAYVAQLEEACRLVADGRPSRLVYQSRSGPPSQPWLEPDILSFLATTEARDVVVAPIGFISDHLEVLYDLDVEAAAVASRRGINLVRAGTVGADARFVAMIRELVLERREEWPVRRALGTHGPALDACQPGCCPAPRGWPEKK